MKNYETTTISVNDVIHTLRECERNERYEGMFEHMLTFASELTGISEDTLMESMYKDESLLQEEPVGERDWFYNNPESNEFFCVYFNPDSNAGGEYVQMSLPYHLILDAAKETGEDPKAFFDYLDARAYTEYVSIGNESFRSQMEHYKANPPDFVRDFVHEDGTEAMNKLVTKARIYRSIDLDGDELKAYKKALIHYAADANGVEHIEGIDPLKLIYCHENGGDLMDFDFWCRFELLVGEEITYDEFQAINETFDGDPYDVEEDDLEVVSRFKETLHAYREANSPTELSSASRENLDSHQIQRSCGIVAPSGYIVGAGFSGLTSELDAAVEKSAELLRDHFGLDVVIRFNSDRQRGGAWVVDSAQDTLHSNCSIGLSAYLCNSKLQSMDPLEFLAISLEEEGRLIKNPDKICFESAIHLRNTEHSVPENSPHILLDSEYRSFDTLEEAANYLFSHVVGLKEKTRGNLDQKIAAAQSKADNMSAKQAVPER